MNVIPNIPKDVYRFTTEEVATVEEEWSAVLIGVLIGKLLSRAALMDYFERNWEVKPTKLFIKDNRVLVLNFTMREDRLWVLE